MSLEPILLKTEDVAKLLQRTPEHVRRLVRGGKLAYRQDGRALRFLREDVDEYLESVKVPAVGLGLSAGSARRNL